ncbi:nucleotidyltransferase domain-containing protein [Candidatus Woesearchaeota archaeon]|nr:nucleotidyltransferase domain-containing protein [Candidatus Woesearchaeota archaeon]
MRESKSRELIAYASAFASWIIPKVEAEEVILFGSVARGDFAEESDIDIFINVSGDVKKQESAEKTARKELELFYASKIGEIWKLKGINHKISLKVGNLEQWQLKRSIVANGIVLYGRYKSMPKNTKAYTQFVLKPVQKISARNRVIRTLFGRKEKGYMTNGLVSEWGGKKLTPLSFVIPHAHTQEIIMYLNEDKVSYTLFEFWTDAF